MTIVVYLGPTLSHIYYSISCSRALTAFQPTATQHNFSTQAAQSKDMTNTWLILEHSQRVSITLYSDVHSSYALHGIRMYIQYCIALSLGTGLNLLPGQHIETSTNIHIHTYMPHCSLQSTQPWIVGRNWNTRGNPHRCREKFDAIIVL